MTRLERDSPLRNELEISCTLQSLDNDPEEPLPTTALFAIQRFACQTHAHVHLLEAKVATDDLGGLTRVTIYRAGRG